MPDRKPDTDEHKPKDAPYAAMSPFSFLQIQVFRVAFAGVKYGAKPSTKH
jgi:hypothetical protein